jgi:hypothetical protein
VPAFADDRAMCRSQLTLQVIDVVEFGQEAGSTLDALTGKPGAHPEKSQALQEIEEAMDAIPQSEIEFYLDGYAGAPSYEEWYRMSPPNRFFELWDHSDEFRAARYAWVMAHVAVELGKLGFDVAY